MAIDTVYTSVDFNAYIDVAEADTRIAGFQPFVDASAWDALADPQKENLIAAGSKDANRFDYFGQLNGSVVSKFNMKWPRRNVIYTNGVQVLPTEIPEFVKSYVAQRIIELLNYTYDQANANLINSNVKKVQVDVISREFFDKFRSSNINVNDFESYHAIQPYVSSGKATSYFLMRG